MAGKKPDYRVMTSRPKRNGDGNIYTTIGAGWQFNKDGTVGISIELDARPLGNRMVLFPVSENSQQSHAEEPSRYLSEQDDFDEMPF